MKTIQDYQMKLFEKKCADLRISAKKNGTFFFPKSILSISLRRGPSLWCQKATGAAYLGFTFGLSSGLSLGASFSLGTWQLKRVKLCGKISDQTILYLCLVLHIYIYRHLVEIRTCLDMDRLFLYSGNVFCEHISSHVIDHS